MLTNKSQEMAYTENQVKVKKKKYKYNVIGCANCGITNTTLLKSTDSYYCKFCFEKLNKKKFKQ